MLLHSIYPDSEFKRAAFSFVNWVDQPTTEITADVQANDLGPRNVVIYQAGIPWEAPGLAERSWEATISFVFGTARSADVLAFTIPERIDDSADADWRPVYGPGDSMRWRLYDAETEGTLLYETDDGAGGAFVDADIDPYVGVSRLLLPSRVGGIVRAELTCKLAAAPAAPFDVVRVARVWIGEITDFEHTFDWGDTMEPGQDAFNTPVRRFTLDFATVRDAERLGIERALQMTRIGGDESDTRQILWLPDMRDNRASALVRVESARFRSKYRNAHAMPITLIEDLAGL